MNLHLRRDREGLVHRAAVRDLQELVLLLWRHSRRKIEAKLHRPDAMGLLGVGPARLDGETLAGDLVPRAVEGHEVADAARQRADKELHRAHPGIASAVFNRLIGHDSVLAARDLEPDAASVDNLHTHRAPLFRNSRMEAFS